MRGVRASEAELNVGSYIHLEGTTNADDEADAVDISCTGTSTDGQDLALDGTTDEIPGASVTERSNSSYPLNDRPIGRCAMAAVHGLEDAIAPGLHGQVQEGHEFFDGAVRFDQIIVNIARV